MVGSVVSLHETTRSTRPWLGDTKNAGVCTAPYFRCRGAESLKAAVPASVHTHTSPPCPTAGPSTCDTSSTTTVSPWCNAARWCRSSVRSWRLLRRPRVVLRACPRCAVAAAPVIGGAQVSFTDALSRTQRLSCGPVPCVVTMATSPTGRARHGIVAPQGFKGSESLKRVVEPLV